MSASTSALRRAGLPADNAAAAGELMQQSSGMFRDLRYEGHLPSAGRLLAAIAAVELQALANMQSAWPTVRTLDAAPAAALQQAAE